ncbi:MAG: acyl-CoA dehydratase activase-related protein, partial [Coriobacteriaceae bacterium]|nr:acyl-CoA dehydratase activase-related protein [Coriobacteriaceae bacterium]
SFIEAFATSLNLDIKDFAAEALKSDAPVDLGSRCTVFMNSRVKQAQKEGATVADISAGLSYSVIKNALFKVIKLRDASELGTHAVVQGGTFLNDAVLRAFELLAGHDAIRPDIAGNMGAWGAALLARDRATEAGSTLLTCAQIDQLEIKHSTARCGLCENNCLLTINDFGKDPETGKRRRFITGNRCERGAGVKRDKNKVPNLFEFKNDLLFDRESLPVEKAKYGTVGIPRALNMYENYPFWHSFFTQLGYRVELSEPSTKATFKKGIESMPSENACYPAKLSHGHIMDLLERDVDFIWMPCIRWERQEDAGANNHYNCPIVMSYSEALKLNIDELRTSRTDFLNPFIPYDDKEALKKRLFEHLVKERKKQHPELAYPSKKEIDDAVDRAWQADLDFKNQMRAQGEKTLQWIEEHNAHGIVLAGRPYHIDNEINHAIPELITSFGMAVLTEDSIAHLGDLQRNLRVYDQWMFHTRLYNAAKVVTQRTDLDLVQLNSFGCGLDALTTDEVQEIIEGSGKVYTVLKIDEVSNLGAARIRIRSLLAALKQKADGTPQGEDAARREILDTACQSCESNPTFEFEPNRVAASTEFPRVEYTKEMQESGEYTILAPQMSPIHFELLVPIFHHYGYNLELLPSVDPGAVDAGLKYVNNDICYPSILVTGQIMEAATSGRYDMDKTAFIITQTGGGCRATNYISLIRKGLHDAGLDQVPVISLAFNDTGESNSGFSVTPQMLKTAVPALLVGDLLMMCLYRVRPYEAEPGSANKLFRKWMDWMKENECGLSLREAKKVYAKIVRDFDTLPCVNFGSKPRVGVVGEILVKFHPTANNQIVDTIEREGCEAVVPGLVDFFLFGILNPAFRHQELTPDLKKYLTATGVVKALEKLRDPIRRELAKSSRFEPFERIEEIAEGASQILDLCNMMGEGWLLTGEMVELINEGAPNIVCTQPFACLPNHVVGKAVIKEMRRRYPQSNIVAVDYDPGASEVNQLNR